MDSTYENASWPNNTWKREDGGFYQEEDEGFNYTYIGITVPIITFCFVSVTMNLVILSSLFWVKRPVTPTLQISISLAFSDLLTLTLDGLGLTFNSLLPIGFRMDTRLSLCTLLFQEAVRLGCRFTTLGHLLALTVNHLLGICNPFFLRTSNRTYRNINIILSFLWTIPTLAFLISFRLIEDDGFSKPGCSFNFMRKSFFRTIISSIFFGSIVAMTIVYAYIYRLVLKNQFERNRLTAGSNCNRTQSQEGEVKNMKALKTTMLIVGSTVLGWLPACLAFYLVCEDCTFTEYGSKAWQIAINSVINILLIVKTALNTYIYAARMTEIKNAMKRMRRSLAAGCCGDQQADWNGLSESRQYHSRNSTRRSLLNTTPL